MRHHLRLGLNLSAFENMLFMQDFLICLTLWNSTPADLLEQSSMLLGKHRPQIKHWFKAIGNAGFLHVLYSSMLQMGVIQKLQI